MQVRKQQLELDMEQQSGSKYKKEYVKAVYCHPAYLTYEEYIMGNAWLEEPQAGIKIAGRNINSLKYADDTTHMAESEEELKSLLMKVKEESEKAGLTFRKLRAWHLVRWTMRDYFFVLQNYSDGNCSLEIKRCLLLGRKVITNLDSILKSRDITLST